MPVLQLDHVNICTTLFEETLLFYESALNLHRVAGASSLSRSLNAWLATEQDVVVIHVNGPIPGEPARSGQASNLDHFALRCSGLETVVERLISRDIAFEQRRLAGRPITQLVIRDPSGIKVELTFEDAAPPQPKPTTA